VFEAHLVSRAQFAEGSSQMMSSPDLVCRVGNVLYPWRVAAPLVLGMLAFGGSWDSLLPEGMAGICVPAPPETIAGEDEANATKVRAMAEHVHILLCRTSQMSCEAIPIHPVSQMARIYCTHRYLALAGQASFWKGH
jgi:hypothetical protein